MLREIPLTHTNKECTDMHFVCGFFCRNGRSAATNYHGRCRGRYSSTLIDSSEYTQNFEGDYFLPTSECRTTWKNCILDAVHRSPNTNVHRISIRTEIAPTEVWRILRGDDFYLRRLEGV
jgi:hypothetical protein